MFLRLLFLSMISYKSATAMTLNCVPQFASEATASSDLSTRLQELRAIGAKITDPGTQPAAKAGLEEQFDALRQQTLETFNLTDDQLQSQLDAPALAQVAISTSPPPKTIKDEPSSELTEEQIVFIAKAQKAGADKGLNAAALLTDAIKTKSVDTVKGILLGHCNSAACRSAARTGRVSGLYRFNLTAEQIQASLILAIKSGSSEMTAAFLSSKLGDVDEKLLVDATKGGQTDIINAVLASNAEAGNEALTAAFEKNNLDVITYVARSPATISNKNFREFGKNAEALKILIQNRPDFSQEKAFVYLGVLDADNTDAFKLLLPFFGDSIDEQIEASVDVVFSSWGPKKVKTASNLHLLEVAVMKRASNVVSYLLEMGADPNRFGHEDLVTASFHAQIALTNPSIEITKKLLLAGADSAQFTKTYPLFMTAANRYAYEKHLYEDLKSLHTIEGVEKFEGNFAKKFIDLIKKNQ